MSKLIFLSLTIYIIIVLGLEVNNEESFKKAVRGTIRLADGSDASEQYCVKQWKSKWQECLKNLGTTSNNKLKIYQNAEDLNNHRYRFPFKELGELIIECDGPREDESLQPGDDGYRGTNRFVLFITGANRYQNSGFVNIVNNGKDIKITRIFLSNNHYKNGHPVVRKGIKALGGQGKFGAHQIYDNYYNAYDYAHNSEYSTYSSKNRYPSSAIIEEKGSKTDSSQTNPSSINVPTVIVSLISCLLIFFICIVYTGCISVFAGGLGYYMRDYKQSDQKINSYQEV